MNKDVRILVAIFINRSVNEKIGIIRFYVDCYYGTFHVNSNYALKKKQLEQHTKNTTHTKNDTTIIEKKNQNEVSFTHTKDRVYGLYQSA